MSEIQEKRKEELKDLAQFLFGSFHMQKDRDYVPDWMVNLRLSVSAQSKRKITVRLEWFDEHPGLVSNYEFSRLFIEGEWIVGLEGLIKTAIHEAIEKRGEKIRYLSKK